jgi:hypothetical protein
MFVSWIPLLEVATILNLGMQVVEILHRRYLSRSRAFGVIVFDHVIK